MLRIGITGNVGSGKTHISQLFEWLNIPVFYADKEAKKITQYDPTIRTLLMQASDQKAFDEMGEINHPIAFQLLISGTEQAQKIIHQIHLRTIERFNLWCAAQDNRIPYCIKEAAIIFEANSSEGLDVIVGVSCPDDIRKKRYLLRKNTNINSFECLQKKQIPTSLKMKLCDKVIYNSGREALLPQVLALDCLFKESSGLTLH